MGKTVIDYMTNLGYRQGDKLYSTIFGVVKLVRIEKEGEPFEIIIEDCHGDNYHHNEDGIWFNHIEGECTLWPDDTCRDWGSAPPLEHEMKYRVYDYVIYKNRPVEIVATESYGQEVTKVRILGTDIVERPDCDVVKTERFDKKLYQPYDKVIVRCNEQDVWRPETVSYVYENTDGTVSVFLQGGIKQKALYIAPYDYTTNYLIGNRSNAPKYFL